MNSKSCFASITLTAATTSDGLCGQAGEEKKELAARYNVIDIFRNFAKQHCAPSFRCLGLLVRFYLMSGPGPPLPGPDFVRGCPTLQLGQLIGRGRVRVVSPGIDFRRQRAGDHLRPAAVLAVEVVVGKLPGHAAAELRDGPHQ